MRVVLIGFRGSGKTAVGRRLAGALRLPWIDTDAAIEVRAGTGIPAIFAARGEAGFRALEREVIAALPADGCVVSAGGGAVLDPENVAQLRAGSAVFFLRAPPAVLEARIRGSNRPALTALSPEEEVRVLLAERTPAYRSAADVCVDTGERGVREVCEAILSALVSGTVSRAACLRTLDAAVRMVPSPAERANLCTILCSKENPLRRLFAITGAPCAHSKSPQLYNHLFSRFTLNYYYTWLEWPDVGDVVDLARKLDIRALSVTIPHKSAVMAHLDEVDAHAAAIGAVNSVLNCGGYLSGYNTDWIGVKMPLDDVEGSRAVVIGAGGAAAAAVYALQDRGMEVCILNRTEGRAAALASRFGCGHGPLSALLSLEPDVLINATPVGMGDDGRSPVPQEHLREGMCVFDLVYTPPKTPLLTLAEERGCRCIPGTEMFAYQAKAQFALFTGIEVEPAIIRRLMQ
ncbi:MAG: shikimate dehydrogenase [Methanomicrobiaceae archaeon]|nr:shikimate dehydrogenase [Methanomicrobiaceae archaeon]